MTSVRETYPSSQFSVPQLLIDQGCVKRICRLVRSSDPSLKLEALFALKNGKAPQHCAERSVRD